MTEIPVWPGETAVSEAPPEPGDWFGLFASLHAHLGKIASNLPDPRRQRYELASAIWPVRIDPIPIPGAAGPSANLLDIPQMLGPQLGVVWDVHVISATGFSAGQVNGWINLPLLAAGQLSGALRAPFNQAGVITNGKGQLILRHGERLCFTQAGITGIAIVSIDATAIREPWLGEYLK